MAARAAFALTALGTVALAFLPPPTASVKPAVVPAEGQTFAPDCLSIPERNWGVQILYLRLSPDRTSVTVRYRVVDGERAALFRRFVGQAELHDPGTKRILASPIIGDTFPRLGSVHDLVFANTDPEIGLRRRVTLRAGPFRLNNLVVRG